MDTRSKRAIKRITVAALLVGGLGGCAVYGPPYAGYDPYYAGYGYPTYGAPPVFLDFGFYEQRHYGKYHGGHHGHGWRGDGGWGHGRSRGHGRSWGHWRGGRH
jgi:hypothetical protein